MIRGIDIRTGNNLTTKTADDATNNANDTTYNNPDTPIIKHRVTFKPIVYGAKYPYLYFVKCRMPPNRAIMGS